MVWVIDEIKGKSLNKYTEGSEPFSGWFGMQDDGVARMVTSVGGRSALVARIDGLDTIKRISPKKCRFQ